MKQENRYAPREHKSRKIISILKDFLGSDLSSYVCLDVGCSNGIISKELSKNFLFTVGIDIDIGKNEDASPTNEKGIYFTIGSGDLIPFPENQFDIVICAQVYEHIKDPKALAREIWRVLRKGGVCFFSGPNRLAIMEEHYWLPFLSWLPRPLSNLYVRIFHQEKDYAPQPLFYWEIRKVWYPFIIKDYTWKLIREPSSFAMDQEIKKSAWLKKIPKKIIKALIPFYPNYNWILVKAENA